MHFSEVLFVILGSIGTIEDLNQFSAYPNPADDILFIKMETESAATFHISLQTIDGKELTFLEKKVTGLRNFEINMADFSAGFYLLKVTNEKGRLVRKITKK